MLLGSFVFIISHITVTTFNPLTTHIACFSDIVQPLFLPQQQVTKKMSLTALKLSALTIEVEQLLTVVVKAYSNSEGKPLAFDLFFRLAYK